MDLDSRVDFDLRAKFGNPEAAAAADGEQTRAGDGLGDEKKRGV